MRPGSSGRVFHIYGYERDWNVEPQAQHATDPNQAFASELIWMATALLLYTLLGTAAKKLGQQKVLGGLLGGVVMALIGFRAENHNLIQKLGEISAMFLLFKAGLETNLPGVLRDARTGWKVATVGVIMPMIGAAFYCVWVKNATWPVALFQGGVFTATSVGITAAVLGELKVMDKAFAKIIISAAVIDDVMGLVVLAVCQTLNAPGPFDAAAVSKQIGIALLFVGVVPVLGHLLTKPVVSRLHRMTSDNQETIMLAFMLFYGAGAIKFGLAAIVGAYFAGVAIEEAYFQETPGTEHGESKPVEHRIEMLIKFFAPIFFVYAGSIVDPKVFADPAVLFTGLIFTLIAVAGKLCSGLLAPKGDRLIVGVGMVPRGEVGIIFATMGMTSGILSAELFGASMIMVMLSTFVTPPLLSWCIKK